jgi:hypothetical protein
MIIVAHLLRRRHRPSRLAALTAEQARTLESLDAAIDLDDSGYASTGDLIGNNDEEYERVEARDTVERLMEWARSAGHCWAFGLSSPT